MTPTYNMITDTAPTPAPAPHGEATRRQLLSGLAGAAVASTALTVATPGAAAEHPDAELMAACAHYEQLEAQYRATCDADVDDLIEDCAPPGYTDTWNSLAGLPALTLEGVQTKARAIIAMYAPAFHCTADAVTWSLIHDVLKLEAAT